jgi:hypothetical protein
MPFHGKIGVRELPSQSAEDRNEGGTATSKGLYMLHLSSSYISTVNAHVPAYAYEVAFFESV